MPFQVVDGRVPERIERFLQDTAGMCVVLYRHRGQSALTYTDANGERHWSRFRWDSDRMPTLQEAIEAVQAQEEIR